MIQFFPGHQGPCWQIELSPEGATCYSVGQDRSLRLWVRGEDLVFVEEEKERAMDYQVDKSAEKEFDVDVGNRTILGELNPNDSSASGNTVVAADDSGATAQLSTVRSIVSIRSGESLMDAIDVVETELAEKADFERKRELSTKLGNTGKSSSKTSKNSQSNTSARGSGITKQWKSQNPLLLGLEPYQYMLKMVRLIKQPDLEQALLLLPFHYVTKFISILIEMARQGYDFELCTRCSIFLLRSHQAQILSTHSLRHEMRHLQTLISTYINDYRTLIGTNIAGLKYIQNIHVEEKTNQLATRALYSEEHPFLASSSKSNRVSIDTAKRQSQGDVASTLSDMARYDKQQNISNKKNKTK